MQLHRGHGAFEWLGHAATAQSCIHSQRAILARSMYLSSSTLMSSEVAASGLADAQLAQLVGVQQG